jgi:hypothetical protein
MVRKQLITLAAILGILGCGACFLPEHYTPPPPPPIVTEGLKNLRVVVRDESKTPRLNTSALAEVIAGNLSRRFSREGLSAHLAYRPEEDGVVEVRILSATALKRPSPPPNGQQAWDFAVQSVASLIRPDGQVVWQGVETTDTLGFDSYAQDAESIWGDPVGQGALLRVIGGRVANGVVVQRSIEKK